MSRISYVEDLQTWEKEFQFSHSVTVRFSETDMFGHLNNTVLFTYFELARIEYFKELGFRKNWIDPQFESIPVVADLQCDFLEQIYYDEKIEIYVKAKKIGNSSVDIHYMGKKENCELAFTGRGTIVQISRFTGKSIPWTEEMKKLLRVSSGLI